MKRYLRMPAVTTGMLMLAASAAHAGGVLMPQFVTTVTGLSADVQSTALPVSIVGFLLGGFMMFHHHQDWGPIGHGLLRLGGITALLGSAVTMISTIIPASGALI